MADICCGFYLILAEPGCILGSTLKTSINPNNGIDFEGIWDFMGGIRRLCCRVDRVRLALKRLWFDTTYEGCCPLLCCGAAGEELERERLDLRAKNVLQVIDLIPEILSTFMIEYKIVF